MVALLTTACNLVALVVFSAAAGHWHITGQRIDLTRKSYKNTQNADNAVAKFIDFVPQQLFVITDGCCGSSMETLDLRRIIDLHFHRSVWQLCCDRGTVSINIAHFIPGDMHNCTVN